MINKELQHYFECLEIQLARINDEEVMRISECLLKRDYRPILTDKMIRNAYPNSQIFFGYGVLKHPFYSFKPTYLLSDKKSYLVKYLIWRNLKLSFSVKVSHYPTVEKRGQNPFENIRNYASCLQSYIYKLEDINSLINIDSSSFHLFETKT